MTVSDAWPEEVWAKTMQPYYYLTAPGGIVLGIYTKAKDVLAQARPGLRIFCQLGYSAEKRLVWPPDRRKT